MKMIFALLTAFLISFTPVSGEIIETPYFKELLNYVQDDSLVILDIDDTLLIPKQTLGIDAWFLSRLKMYQTLGDQVSALNKALAEWEAVRHLTEMKIVEEGTVEIIEELQQRQITVMALTTQGLGLSLRTPTQLRELNIHLMKTAPSQDEHYFMNGQGVLYSQGILFTAGSPKGTALLKFLDKIAFSPRHIVFINDKASHLKDMEASLKAEGISFTGLRYSYGDAKLASYRPEIARIQWEHSSFGHILSDEEAELLLLSQSVEN